MSLSDFSGVGHKTKKGGLRSKDPVPLFQDFLLQKHKAFAKASLLGESGLGLFYQRFERFWLTCSEISKDFTVQFDFSQFQAIHEL